MYVKANMYKCLDNFHIYNKGDHNTCSLSEL